MQPRVREYYCDAGETVRSGIWQCEAGNIEIKDNPVAKVCFVLNGVVQITDLQSRSETFGTGECFVMPRGFSGTWSHSDRFRMTYVVIAPSRTGLEDQAELTTQAAENRRQK
jgi:uncharacterized cupin superfamily protein